MDRCLYPWQRLGDKAVSFDGDTWKLMDPTFDANSDGDEAIQEYIGDESNYTVQFTR